jgi:hypothetical protein
MIEDDEELAIVQRQLDIVERIVESWRQDLLPHNPRNFGLYAEGAIDQAAILRADINEYLERRKSLPPTTSTPQPTADHPPAS